MPNTTNHWTTVASRAAGELQPIQVTSSGQATTASSAPIRMTAWTTVITIAVNRSFQKDRVSVTP